jgi:hypothetical protein
MSIRKFTNKEETQFHLQVCISLKTHIQKKYNLIVHREWYIILDNNDKIVGIPTQYITEAQKARREKYRNPDLLWWNNGLYILEVDGYVHHIKSGKTEKRNDIYKNNNVKFMTVNTYEMGKNSVKNRSIESIINEVDEMLNG